jgi:hypothetical protein
MNRTNLEDAVGAVVIRISKTPSAPLSSSPYSTCVCAYDAQRTHRPLSGR